VTTAQRSLGLTSAWALTISLMRDVAATSLTADFTKLEKSLPADSALPPEADFAAEPFPSCRDA